MYRERSYAGSATPADAPVGAVIGESPRHLATLTTVLAGSGGIGARIHDAQIAAICIDHGVTQFLTADRGFTVFPSVRVSDPFRLP